jgi:hypothetical protein
MERMRNNYEEKLDRERASNENSKRDSEASIQALRETMDLIRKDYEKNFTTKNDG